MIDRNENRPGYRKTKVGWIPREWEAITFGKVVAKSQYGLSIASSNTGHIQILGMKDIAEGYVSFNDLAKVDITNDQLKKYLVTDGDLLFNRTNSLEHVGKLGIVISAKSAVFASYLVRFQLKQARTLPEYVSYIFNTEDARNRLRNLATPGVCQHNINQSVLQKHFVIPLPPLPEQKKIAEILSTWDEAIEQTRKLIEAKKRRKKALMQQLLTGKKRLPGFLESEPRLSFRFFSVPADWNCPRISEVAEEHSVRNRDDLQLKVYTCSKHHGFVESMKYFGKRVFSEDTSNYKLIYHNWFGFPSNHVEEGSIGLLYHPEKGIVSPIYVVFSFNEKADPGYMFSILKTETYRHIYAISTNASVNRRGSLRWREFSQIRIPLPSIHEQHAINDVLNAAEAEIKTTEKILATLKKQKRGLMQKLLTGEVRVSV